MSSLIHSCYVGAISFRIVIASLGETGYLAFFIFLFIFIFYFFIYLFFFFFLPSLQLVLCSGWP